MSVETSSMFERVIQDHLALKERNARLDGKMPIERYKDEDRLENHPLFKTEEQARIEETMDGVDPDFSDETLEDVGLGMWPEAQATPAVESWSDPVQVAEVEDATVENGVPEVEETTGFWNTGGVRDFDWGD
ncbi:MAG: hypothetical protein QOG85_1955 [Gaiellaceae bacterium]|jgi:hypothetical protein|nr:hypothetical protein [Gaiellaceae bacterium]